jgi:hypothetical protein
MTFAIHLGKCGSLRIKRQCRRVASISSCSLVTAASMITARRGRFDCRNTESGAAMDWLERSFMALTLLCAVGAAISIAWIMLI